MNKIYLRIKQELFNLRYFIVSLFGHVDKKVENQVPFVCQFATPESAEKSLRKEFATIDDPDWKNTGAKTPEEYGKWAFTMCGMACTSMVLEYFHGEKIAPVILAQDALENGVYQTQGADISDMKYREYALWIQKYRLGAEVCTSLTLRGIEYALSRGSLVIVSVNPNIRGYDTAPKEKKGGHLVLVTGFDRENHTLTLNNPSGFYSLKTQHQHTLSVSEFTQYFACRGIILSWKKL